MTVVMCPGTEYIVFLSLSIIYFMYMSVSLRVCMHVYHVCAGGFRGQYRALDILVLELHRLLLLAMRVLRLHPGSSARATNTLNH